MTDSLTCYVLTYNRECSFMSNTFKISHWKKLTTVRLVKITHYECWHRPPSHVQYLWLALKCRHIFNQMAGNMQTAWYVLSKKKESLVPPTVFRKNISGNSFIAGKETRIYLSPRKNLLSFNIILILKNL